MFVKLTVNPNPHCFKPITKATASPPRTALGEIRGRGAFSPGPKYLVKQKRGLNTKYHQINTQILFMGLSLYGIMYLPYLPF
jgi:hypothetical protein